MRKKFVSILTALAYFVLFILCQSVGAISITENEILGSIVSNIVFLVVLFIIFYVKRINIKEYLQINGISLKKCIFVVLLSLAVNLLFQSIQLLFPDNLRQELITDVNGRLSGNIYVAFIAVVLLAPLTEEILFRGLLFRTLKRGMNVYAAAVLQALIFGVMHGNIIWILVAIPTALFYAFLMEKYKSIAAPLIGHIAVNLLAFIMEL